MKAEIKDDGYLEVTALTALEGLALKAWAEKYMTELLDDVEFPITLDWSLSNVTTITISALDRQNHGI